MDYVSELSRQAALRMRNQQQGQTLQGQTTSPWGTGAAPPPPSANWRTGGPGTRHGTKPQNWQTMQQHQQAQNPQPAYGSQSGPGILESWFNQRANGTDPAYEYAMRRGMESLGNQSAAAGSFNSGAARQQESDFAANMGAQRLGQLDALAGGASGEHQGRVNSMFQQGQALAGGQAGLASAYDLGAAGNMQAANQAMTQMALNSAAQQQQAHAGFANNLLQAYGLSQSGGGGGGGYYNANNPYPV